MQRFGTANNAPKNNSSDYSKISYWWSMTNRQCEMMIIIIIIIINIIDITISVIRISKHFDKITHTAQQKDKMSLLKKQQQQPHQYNKWQKTYTETKQYNSKSNIIQ